MTYEEFESCFESRVDLCRRVLVGKNTEYARGGDKLSNFKKAGGMQGCSAESALQGMMAKHQVSIVDLIKDLDAGQHHNITIWEEKIGDALNYLFLLRSLLGERYRQ
jgi:hypothetical protein